MSDLTINSDLPVFNGESWEDHVSAWHTLSSVVKHNQLQLAAIAHSVAGKWKETGVNKFAGEVGIKAKAVYHYIKVYSWLEKSTQVDFFVNSPLSFTHLRVAAYSKDPALAEEVLIEAEDRNLSVEATIELLQTRETAVLQIEAGDTCTVTDLHSLANNNKKFKTIYADPPWRYGNQATRSSTDNHYPTLSVEEIAALPIRELADEDCHLHLWTTNAFIFDCKQIMEAWGFEYKSVFVWAKPTMGIGNYWRVSHEFLLLGIKGNAPFMNRSQMSWAQLDRTKHSEKPEAVRKMIELVSPAPRLELFGRRVADGWTVWGNEIKRTMFDKDVREGIAKGSQIQAVA